MAGGSFGSRIREERENKGLSQRQVCEIIGRTIINQTALSKIETGGKKVRREHAIRLAQCFQLEMGKAIEFLEEGGFLLTSTELRNWDEEIARLSKNHWAKYGWTVGSPNVDTQQ